MNNNYDCNLKPLCIEFIVDERSGVWFGWNLEREKIDPYTIPTWTEKSMGLVRQWVEEGSLVKRINEQVVNFFNGAIGADIKIPNNYPYQLYEHGKSELCVEGKLREK